MTPFNPDKLTFIRDTREQDGYVFPRNAMEERALPVADYSIRGLEGVCRIERKSFADLLQSLTAGRDRFRKEMELLRAYRWRCVVVEAGFLDVSEGNYRSRMHPAAPVATVASWSGKYAPIYFCGDRNGAQQYCREFLVQAARTYWQVLETVRRAMEAAA